MSKLRILLVNVGLRRPLYPLATPPMGILYLAAYLRERFDAEIRIIDQRLGDCPPDELVRRALDIQPEIIGLSCFTTAAHLLPETSGKLRAALPGALQVLGGPHASAAQAEALRNTEIDLAVAGEGERPFERIVQEWRDGRQFAAIPGLIRREAGGVTVNEGRIPQIEELDALPMPAYDLIDLPAYWKNQSIAPIPKRRYVSLVSSRGCPYACSWCHKIFERCLRKHSAERVVDEIEYFHRKYEVTDFEFLDDNFNFDAKRVIRFADLLREKGLRIRLAFPTALRGDLVTEEVADALKAAGTYLCGYSLETGSPRLQKLNQKFLNIPKFLNAVRLTEERRIFITGFCMMGFPTETEEELQQTIDVACEARFHTASFFTVTPFPGTPIHEYVQQTHPEKLAGINYDDSDFSLMRVNLTDLPDDTLFAYQRKAMRRFYANPRRIASFLRCYPQPLRLPVYLPIFLHRATKGLFKP